jgi:hypothetical protein
VVIGQISEAKNAFNEAICNDADCYEALYNIGKSMDILFVRLSSFVILTGIMHRTSGDLTKALDVFKKLARLLPHAAEVLFQLVDL